MFETHLHLPRRFTSHPPCLAVSFATNLFVGAVIEAYQTLSSEDASFLMTDAQKSWLELQKMASVASLKPHPRRPARLVSQRNTLKLYRSHTIRKMSTVLTTMRGQDGSGNACCWLPFIPSYTGYVVFCQYERAEKYV